MGDVEKNAEETLELVQNEKRRHLFYSWWWPNSRQRLPAVRWPKCSRFCLNRQDASPDLICLQVLFILILILSVIRIFGEIVLTEVPGAASAPWLFIWNPRWMAILLVVFAAIFAIRVMVERRTASSSRQWKVEVKTVSGLIQV